MISLQLGQLLLEVKKKRKNKKTADVAITKQWPSISLHLTPGYTGINNGFLYDEEFLI